MQVISILLLGFLIGSLARATSAPTLRDQCVRDMQMLPGNADTQTIKKICEAVQSQEGCESVERVPIYHYEKGGAAAAKKRIIVFSLIHGDEAAAGALARYWMERLDKMSPRNEWRVVPVLNPDGLKRKTRTNAHKIDLNRNFPTKDWTQLALETWKKMLKSNPRRFPGNEAGSEPEVRCAMKHIETFKPDFIVSIHTPLKVLDFDGPPVHPPKFDLFPWKSLGHYPGSLGRYMWFERGVPVLTTELADGLPRNRSALEKLQDLIGQLAAIESTPREARLSVPTEE